MAKQQQQIFEQTSQDKPMNKTKTIQKAKLSPTQKQEFFDILEQGKLSIFQAAQTCKINIFTAKFIWQKHRKFQNIQLRKTRVPVPKKLRIQKSKMFHKKEIELQNNFKTGINQNISNCVRVPLSFSNKQQKNTQTGSFSDNLFKKLLAYQAYQNQMVEMQKKKIMQTYYMMLAAQTYKKQNEQKC